MCQFYEYMFNVALQYVSGNNVRFSTTRHGNRVMEFASDRNENDLVSSTSLGEPPTKLICSFLRSTVLLLGRSRPDHRLSTQRILPEVCSDV